MWVAVTYVTASFHLTFSHFLSHQVAPKGPLAFCESGYVRFRLEKHIYSRYSHVHELQSQLMLCMRFKLLSHVWPFATLRTVACQSLLSMGFAKYGGLLWPPRGDHPDPGIKICVPLPCKLQANALPLGPPSQFNIEKFQKHPVCKTVANAPGTETYRAPRMTDHNLLRSSVWGRTYPLRVLQAWFHLVLMTIDICCFHFLLPSDYNRAWYIVAV